MEQVFLIVAITLFSISVFLFTITIFQDGQNIKREIYLIESNKKSGKVIKLYKNKTNDRGVKIVLYNMTPGQSFEFSKDPLLGKGHFQRRLPTDY